MALRAGRVGVKPDQVNAQGEINGVDIPIATSSKAGLVQPVSKTAGMTQDVGIDSSGKLFTAGGGKFTKTLLADSASGSTINLSDDYDKFDMLQILATTVYNGVSYHVNEWYDVSDIAIGAGIGVWTDGNALILSITSKNVFTINSSTLATGTFKIFGITL